MGLQWVYCQYPCCIGNLRTVIAVFVICAIVIGYCHRVCLNIGMVEMVDHSAVKPQCTNTIQEEPVIKDIVGGKINWSESDQGYTLSSFYIGYLVTHIPGGILCDMYGPRYPLFAGMLLSTITTAFIPIGTTEVEHCWVVFSLRIVTGAAQGVLYPAVSSTLSRWIPACERATIGSAVFAAGSIGLVVGNFCTGMLISAMRNWPIAFYLWAGIGLIYCLLFLVYVFSDPTTHPYLHTSEFEYLQSTMTFKQKMKIPLKRVLLDKSIYGLIIIQMGHDLIVYVLTSNLPKYMNQVLGLTLQQNALVSLIFLFQWVSGLIAGVIADYLIKKKNANVTFMRKSYTLFSNLLSSVFIILAIFCECNTYLAVSSFALAILLKGIFFAGGKVNIVDISLNHSGFVMSLVNGISAIVGIGCSSIVGLVAKNNTFYEWRILVLGIGVFEVITCILYAVLTTAKRSDWDYADNEEKPVKKPGIRWYQQLTPSDHEIRKQKDTDAQVKQKTAAKEAREKMKHQV